MAVLRMRSENMACTESCVVFNTGPYTVLPDNSILITANMQSETCFPSSHQLKSYVASKSRLKLAAHAVLLADAGLLVLFLYMGCTLAPPGECDWNARVQHRCGLMSNYFDHLFCNVSDSNLWWHCSGSSHKMQQNCMSDWFIALYWY